MWSEYGKAGACLYQPWGPSALWRPASPATEPPTAGRVEADDFQTDVLLIAAHIEIERLRAWVYCPEHGPLCGDDDCCCVDKHQPELAQGAN